ncbi:FAD-dependent oxidoreductase [Cellulomonas marina]|uniref:FAD dependent oxidoreductase n=1 Tax=Cellulomonas marina TaxID=988821 RepID=A0A1I1A5D9_9CELL|nr:FAD-dependent oxidoreductase [Cellulomonas marina]GIG29567.1 hypothetical protein Cma02nite_21670 [Cellulomonas marina]SFB33161.1 FAD dependent oxidoreductase [Cellulomonas marina]
MSGAADVAVLGATAAGVCAAVAAAEAGARVVLVEPGGQVGGMTSGGLGYTDLGDERVVRGAAARFRRAVADRYGVAVRRWAGPEPHVAEEILRSWLDHPRIEVRLGERLVGVRRQDGRVTALLVEPSAGRTGTGAEPVPGVGPAAGAGPSALEAAVVVDATYEGDLLAAAGVPSRTGREDRALHGETLAGRREVLPGRHAMPAGLSPFVDDPAGLVPGPVLAGVRDVPLAEVGTGDGGVMSYGYRVCLTTAADRLDLADLEVPASYASDGPAWELGRRLLHHWARTGTTPTAGELLGLEPNLPGGKCDANSLGPFSLSVLDGSAWAFPGAGLDEREALRAHHRHHAAGFLRWLATDPLVPASVRRDLRRWGLPHDEFADTGHLPHQLYVREGRRMVGAHVLAEHDLRAPAHQHDTVAHGSYHLDVREVQRTWRWLPEHPRPVAEVVTEGYYSVAVPPYPIPYRALVPRAQDATNLVVPMCLSASHVAFSSVRMEPQYQMLGEAAGVAAALAAADGRDVQAVDVVALQAALAGRGRAA